jgi:hypothetical protein
MAFALDCLTTPLHPFTPRVSGNSRFVVFSDRPMAFRDPPGLLPHFRKQGRTGRVNASLRRVCTSCVEAPCGGTIP